MTTVLETATAIVLIGAIIPLGVSIFYYATEPVPGRWWRRPSRIWMQSWVGRIILVQWVVMFTLLSFILVVRWTGGFAAREWIALGLYLLIVITFWLMLLTLRDIQRHPPKE